MPAFIKKLGEPHAAVIQVELSEVERAYRRKMACDVRDQLAALAEEKKLKMAELNLRKKALENQEAVSRGQASTGIEEIAVVVQDVLTAGNEVLSMQLDAEGHLTNIIAAKRTATADELQEEMFGGSEESH